MNRARWIIASLCATLVICAVISGVARGSIETKGKTALTATHLRKVGQVQCGDLGGRWVPGAVAKGPKLAPGKRWFISFAQEAADYRAATKLRITAKSKTTYLSRAAALKTLATVRAPLCVLRATLTAADPSGQAMPTGDIPGWHQVFADDFSQTVPLGSFPAAVAAKWGNSYPDGWQDTSKNGTYMPSQVVSISNGVMNLHLHTENGVHMVAAVVPTVPGAPGSDGGLLYGRYVVRFRTDSVPGYKTAFLLWPDSGTFPGDGEIDFPEGNLDSTIWGYVHFQAGTSSTDQVGWNTGIAYAGPWHTAAITWLPSGVTYQLDGQTIGTTTTLTPNRTPATPMHLVIQAETALGVGPPADSAAGNVQIAWVDIYRPS